MTVTPSGNYSATLPIVAQCHNQLRTVTEYCTCRNVNVWMSLSFYLKCKNQLPFLTPFLYPWTLNSALYFLLCPIISPRIETTPFQPHRRHHSPFWSFLALLPTSVSLILYIFFFLFMYRIALLVHRMSQLYILACWYNFTSGTGWCVMLVCWKMFWIRDELMEDILHVLRKLLLSWLILSAQTRRRGKVWWGECMMLRMLTFVMVDVVYQLSNLPACSVVHYFKQLYHHLPLCNVSMVNQQIWTFEEPKDGLKLMCDRASYTGCHRRNGPNFGRVFLMLKYTDITQNTYIQSWTVTETMAREVWNFDSCYTLTDCEIHIETFL